MISASSIDTTLSLVFSPAVSVEGVGDLSRYRVESQLGVKIQPIAIKQVLYTDLTETFVLVVDFEINRPTFGVPYSVRVAGQESFFSPSSLPVSTFQLIDASMGEEGQVELEFSHPLSANPALSDPGSYSISGGIEILKVTASGPKSVLLHTSKMSLGLKTVTVLGTLKDSSNNLIDPLHVSATFLGAPAISHRSIFTDQGPITKPKLVLQSGSTGEVLSQTRVRLPGASILPAHVGLYIELAGTAGQRNDGRFKITSRVSSNTVNLAADLHIPDASSGSLAWSLVDMRHGMIADSPSDVTVLVNSVPVIPEQVIGLLGQVVLPMVPAPTDTVSVSYSWIDNPSVWFYRTNSLEFLLNNYEGVAAESQSHRYPFLAGLMDPGGYISGDLTASLDQPRMRDLKYRAFERDYSIALNDPGTLLLNAPHNKVAFPQLERPTTTVSINYTAEQLPELSAQQWRRYGSGSATAASGKLTVSDSSSTGGLYWTKGVDLTPKHVFAQAWRVKVLSTSATQGVWCGVAAGFSDQNRCFLLGYLLDGGIKKIGILKDGYANDPSTIAAWTGGLDSNHNPTFGPIECDWAIERSYRLLRGLDGTISVYLDGSVTPSLKTGVDTLPILSTLTPPFDSLQGVFFGSLSLEAQTTSQWEFVQYTAIPSNPKESAPSIYVSYEGSVLPVMDSTPWTPIGFHGTETISASKLVLDSTSGASAVTGFVNGEFHGFVRVEPLLSLAQDVALDLDVSVPSWTHGLEPNAIMAAIDDGDRLLQLSLVSDAPAPLISYGGRTLPGAFSPYVWTRGGSGSESMVGRLLSTTGEILYSSVEVALDTADERVLSHLYDWVIEARLQVLSYSPDANGYIGAMASGYDGLRDVGFQLLEEASVKKIELHSNGVGIPSGKFSVDWTGTHTIRIAKSTIGNLVTLFLDTTFVGSVPYSNFLAPASGPGTLGFGSLTSNSGIFSNSTLWSYCNAWRPTSSNRYVGLWRGTSTDSLLDYHLPLRVSRSTGIAVSGNALQDPDADFVASGVVPGDVLLVRGGSNRGVYTIRVVSPTQLTLDLALTADSGVEYQVGYALDWSNQTRYRIWKNEGSVAVFVGNDSTPIIRVDYLNTELPLNSLGFGSTVSGGLPYIMWGAFAGGELSQSRWDYVRYGIVRSLTGQGIAPHHQVLNQQNVIASFEHHQTAVPHQHVNFWSSSEGIPPQTAPDLQLDPTVLGFTRLNDDTPLVPMTRTLDIRNPQPTLVAVGGLNDPENLLGDPAFVTDDYEYRVEILIPDDVIYNHIQVNEASSGVPDLLAPASDRVSAITLAPKSTCTVYNGSQLPENSTQFPTGWQKVSVSPTHQFSSSAPNELTYGTDSTGTQTAYTNRTSFVEAPTLKTEVTIRMKVVSDSSFGLGDSQIRVGATIAQASLALGFVTYPTGARYVVVIDLGANRIVGAIEFDYLDQQYHDYRITRIPHTGKIYVTVDSGVLTNSTEPLLTESSQEPLLPFGGGVLIP